jgi:Lyzozyme M1 (1,4-beta-N-acetylmuramidase)
MPSNTFTGIIDIYHENGFSVASTVAAGVTAVLHKASEGTSSTDEKYATRKAAAINAGLLWGAFHLTNGGKPKKQLDNFLGMEDGSAPNILLALDWERSKDGTIVDIDGIREFVQLFHDALGRYPVLYGGWTLRDTPEIVMGDELLGKCPLWYQRYNWEPRALPVRTWPTYTLWQFADENRGFGAHPRMCCRALTSTATRAVPRTSLQPGHFPSLGRSSTTKPASSCPANTKSPQAASMFAKARASTKKCLAHSVTATSSPGLTSLQIGAG